MGIAYRKVCNKWYDLNSQSNFRCIDPQPVRISDFFLSSKICTMQDDGFQVYVIKGTLHTLGRFAPKYNELKGEYVWYQSADVSNWTDLEKESRKKQMRQGTDMNGMGMGTLSMYEQEQQIIAMQ